MPSRFRFSGNIHPGGLEIRDSSETQLELNLGRTRLLIEGDFVHLDFIAEMELFEDLVAEVDEFMRSFLAAQSISSLYPLNVIWREWTEQPIDPKSEKEPVRGRIVLPVVPNTPITDEAVMTIIARGMEWYKEMEFSPFLRRAVLDFSYALEQPLNEIPMYLARAIESAEHYFGGEKGLIEKLKAKGEVKKVKKIANDSLNGLHTRHAAMTTKAVKLKPHDVQDAVKATANILQRFHGEVWSEMLKSQKENTLDK